MDKLMLDQWLSQSKKLCLMHLLGWMLVLANISLFQIIPCLQKNIITILTKYETNIHFWFLMFIIWHQSG